MSQERVQILNNPMYKRLEKLYDELATQQRDLQPLIMSPLLEPKLIDSIIRQLRHTRVSVSAAMKQMRGEPL